VTRNGLAAAVVFALACARLAQAHQLDEYLQAARIGIEPGRIVVEMSLTPGAAVARQVFSSLDRNADGQIDASETEAYGASVMSDVVLEVDGRVCTLRLVRTESPSWSEMREGLGTIRLQADARVGLTRGRHWLRFVNHHRSDIGVYLVNALAPSTRDIVITSQERDRLQHGIVLQFGRSLPYAGALWVVFPIAAATVLMLYRRLQPDGAARLRAAGAPARLAEASAEAGAKPPGSL